MHLLPPYRAHEDAVAVTYTEVAGGAGHLLLLELVARPLWARELAQEHADGQRCVHVIEEVAEIAQSSHVSPLLPYHVAVGIEGDTRLLGMRVDSRVTVLAEALEVVER